MEQTEYKKNACIEEHDGYRVLKRECNAVSLNLFFFRFNFLFFPFLLLFFLIESLAVCVSMSKRREFDSNRTIKSKVSVTHVFSVNEKSLCFFK